MIPSFTRPILNKDGKSYVNSGWGSDRSYRGVGKFHNGFDYPSAPGKPIFAAASGTILGAGDKAPDPSGKMITIDHGDGWRTRYLHLDKIFVKKGEAVTSGQRIGNSGSSGIKVSQAHLHFDVRVTPEGLAAYLARFGKPKAGAPWPGEKASSGVGVPAEPLIPVDVYADAVRANAERYGIPLYKGVGPLVALVGVSLIFLL